MLNNNILGKNLVSELNLDQDTLIRAQDTDIVRILAAENNISFQDIKDSLFTGGGAEFIGKLREYGNFDLANRSGIAQNTASDDLVIENLLVPEAAKTYTVTTAVDENDGGSGGTGLSLREAVTLANANDGADTIKFATSLNGQRLSLINNQIVITDDVTIDGGGRNSTIISGVFDRIFTVDDGSSSTTIDVTIEGVTLTKGLTSGEGGAISNRENLTIENSKISDNSATGYGGGIWNDAILTITDTTISGNISNGNGGGIRNRYGVLTLTNSTISGNTANDNGGGISNRDGTVTVTNSTISGNTANDDGGGIYNYGISTITNSTITGNTSGSGGGIENRGTATVTNTTISGNNAVDGGGGIRNNSTITVANSTITGNNARYGGGIANSSRFQISSTIVAGNVYNNDVSGSFASAGNNLIGNGTNSSGFNANQDDIVGTSTNIIDPLLAPLADNGGPTKTHALQQGSVAIDAGSNVFGLTTDQRGQGFSRTVGGGTDIGAFEVQNSGGGSIINGTPRNDTLRGTSINETINGLEGNDQLFGNGGNDKLNGGDGNDQLNGGDGKDSLFGNEGNDELFGNGGNDKLNGNNGNDELNGSDGNDNLFGNNGNDNLLGGAGIDILDGGTGKDTLNGGIASDLLTGGAGGDIFVLSKDAGGDRITDFEDGIDKIELTGDLTFNSLTIVNGYEQAIILTNINNQLSALATLDNITPNLLTGADFIIS